MRRRTPNRPFHGLLVLGLVSCQVLAVCIGAAGAKASGPPLAIWRPLPEKAGGPDWSSNQEPSPVSLEAPEKLSGLASCSLILDLYYEAPGRVLACGGDSLVLEVDPKGFLVFSAGLAQKPGRRFSVRSAAPLPTGRWVQVAAVNEGGALALYLDGLYASRKPGGFTDPLHPIGQAWLLGGFRGEIRGLAVYEGALSPARLLSLAGRPGLARQREPLERLLFFSFSTPRYLDLTPRDMKVIDRSPFDGVCARLCGAYDKRDPDPAQLAGLDKKGRGRVWPLVFLNRMVGSPEKHPCRGKKRGQDNWPPWADNIDGLDLYDEAGGLSAFLANFTLALETARDSGAPGVFLDPEAYNCYDAYQVTDLAARHKKTVEEIETRLNHIGRSMAGLCHRILPDGVVFFYFLDLGEKARDGRDRSVARIALGMLDEAREKNLRFRVVDGWTGRYVYASLADARHEVETSFARKAPYLERYPNLDAAVVAAPYETPSALPSESWIRKDLLRRDQDLGPRVNGVSDFGPIYRYLFSNMRQAWIYGAKMSGPAGGYDLFSARSRLVYGPVLESALAHIRDRKGGVP